MSGKKTSFVLYNDYKDSVDKLDNEQAGKLFKMILDYVNGQEVEPENLLLELVFLPIKKSLARDLQKYKNKIEERSNAGVLGNLKKHYPDLYDEYKAGKIDVEEALNLAKVRKSRKSEKTIANVADSVNENGSVSEIEIEIEIENKNDGDGDEKEINITDAANLLLKNKEVANAFCLSFKLKDRNELIQWQKKFHLQLAKDEISKKTYKDYKKHFDGWLRKQELNNQNGSQHSSYNYPVPVDPDRYESGKLKRI